MDGVFSKIYNKKIFAVLPVFNGYEKVIIKILNNNNNKVFFAIENLCHHFKILTRIYKINNRIGNFIIYCYYMFIILTLPYNMDYVFIIKGQHISNKIIDMMNIHFKNDCKYIIYQWDSSINNSNIMNIYKRFDSISTFDIEDSKKYKWKYRPLFFIDDYIKEDFRDIDILFLGTIHTDRLKVLSIILQITYEKNVVFVSKLFQRFSRYLLHKYFRKENDYSHLSLKNIITKRMEINDVYNLYNRTKILLDYTNPNQTGFTMRTIESIGCKCKLITNNKYIMLQDFYNPNNIMIYDGVNVTIPDDFLKSPFVEINQEVYNKYSIYNWLNDIFDV